MKCRPRSLLLAVHDLPHGGDIKPQPREQGRLIKIKMIIVVRSSNIGADAHISSLSAVGLDFCHQVGGILRPGESGFLYIIGDLRDSRGSGPDERFQLCTAVGHSKRCP